MRILPKGVVVVKEFFGISRTSNAYVITISLKIAEPCAQIIVMIPVIDSESIVSIESSTNVTQTGKILGAIGACVAFPEHMDDATLQWLKTRPLVYAIGETQQPNESIAFMFRVQNPCVCIPLGVPANRASPPVLTEVNITGTHNGFAKQTSDFPLLIGPSLRNITYNKTTRPHHDLVEIHATTTTSATTRHVQTQQEASMCLVQ